LSYGHKDLSWVKHINFRFLLYVLFSFFIFLNFKNKYSNPKYGWLFAHLIIIIIIRCVLNHDKPPLEKGLLLGAGAGVSVVPHLFSRDRAELEKVIPLSVTFYDSVSFFL
jgi:hypothetical protein